MVIESDRAEAVSGVRHGVTTGAPIALMIPNKDWENWQRTMAVEAPARRRTPGRRSRGGHPASARSRRPRRRVKYDHDDIRNVLERASARETAARVAVGAVARQFSRATRRRTSSATSRRLVRRRLAIRWPSPSTTVRAIPADSPLHCVRRRRRTADDGGHRRGQGGRRHDGRQLRSHRPRRAGRTGQPRSVGPQARWPARAGPDVDSGDQGCRHRPRRRRRRRSPARRFTTRSCRSPGRRRHPDSAGRATDEQRRRSRRRASPTAKTSASRRS